MAKKSNKKAGKKTDKSAMKKEAQGFMIPAGIFIGLGIGFLIQNVAMGLFFGLGGGFLLAGLIAWSMKR